MTFGGLLGLKINACWIFQQKIKYPMNKPDIYYTMIQCQLSKEKPNDKAGETISLPQDKCLR